MDKIDLEKAKKEKAEYDATIRKQTKIQNEFSFLLKCDQKELQAKFVLAQAKEICKYLYRLKFTPFRSWESLIKNTLEHIDHDFLYEYYLTTNEFGEYIPDEERIKALILTDADPEEFPEGR